MLTHHLKNRTFAVALLAALCTQVAEATTYTVTSNEDTEDMMNEECDPQPGELRHAIEAANANAGADTVVFSNIPCAPTPCRPEIGLSEFCGTIVITDDLTIDGSGVTDLVISAEIFTVFEIAEDVEVTIKDLCITGDLSEGGDGAAIYNKGDLTLEDCTLTGFADSGGAIYNTGICSTQPVHDGDLLLIDCTISDCLATDGGAIYNVGGDVVLDGTLIDSCDTDASGGGIYNEDGCVLLKNESEITGCHATAQGGGVLLIGLTPTLTVDNSDICGNSATEEEDGEDLYVSGGTYSIVNMGTICKIEP